jgi:hypothetical protein
MENGRGVWKEQSRQQDCAIRHVTIRAMHPAALAEFYHNVFERVEEPKALKDPNHYLTDGTVTLALTPWKIEDYLGTEHRGPGLDHIGFRVESGEGLKQDLDVLTGRSGVDVSEDADPAFGKRGRHGLACPLPLWQAPALRPRRESAGRFRVMSRKERSWSRK